MNKKLKVMSTLLSGVLIASNIGILTVSAKQTINSTKDISISTENFTNKIINDSIENILDTITINNSGVNYNIDKLSQLKQNCDISEDDFNYFIKNLKYIDKEINNGNLIVYDDLIYSKNNILLELPSNNIERGRTIAPSYLGDPDLRLEPAGGKNVIFGYLYLNSRNIRTYYGYYDTKQMLRNFRKKDPLFMGLNLAGIKSTLISIASLFGVNDEQKMSRAFLDSNERGVYMQWRHNAYGTRFYGPYKGETVPNGWSFMYKYKYN